MTTMRMSKKIMPKERNRKAIFLTALILCLALAGAILLGVVLHGQKQAELKDYRNEQLQWLIDRRGEYDESRIVLADTSESAAKALAEKLNATLRITSDGHFAALTLPEGTTILDVYRSDDYLKDLPRMSADCQVRISELTETEEEVSKEHLPARPQYTVTDSDYNLQTYLDYLNLKTVWNSTKGYGITVAVIDTGIDTDHPEFSGRISEYSYNATEDKIVKDYLLENGSYDWSLIEDEQGHGTAVAGVIGASMNSGAVVGIAPQVTLLVIKAECDENGVFKRTSDLVFGLYYAIERDVAVVNMSFGGYGSSNPYAAATQLAYDSDIICVAAAGNDATAALCYPAADEHVFGVGALEEDGWGLAAYSNYGENTDFVAPGTVYTTKMGGGYGTMNGTSFASPITAGVLALYLSQHKYEEFNTVQEVLYASCYDLGDLGCDWYFGYGALDVSALLLEEKGTVTFHMLTDELENTKQIFIRNHTLQNIPEPERLYAIFDGWYYDPQCTDEYDWYADAFVSDLTLYANWVNEEDGVPYTYVELEDGTIEIRSYTGHRRYVTIPDYIDGKVVSSIGVGAFAGQTRIREVNLPKYLVRIRDSAFSGCSNLLHITVPDTVTEIGASAFYDNVRMSYVAFGSGSQLKSIGSFAFKGCAKLTRFELPATLERVDGSAFFGATSVTAFAVREGNTAFTEKDGVLLNKTASTLVSYPAGLTGAYTVPSTVRSVGDYAFAFTRLRQIDLAGIESIGGYAFAYSSLEGIVIPDTAKAMGDAAFVGSYNLKSVKLGSGLTGIAKEAFFSCMMLSGVEIPANIQTIERSAFAGTSSLSAVTFAPDSRLVQIGMGAFAQSGLWAIEIPASVIVIGAGAFSQNFMLSSVTFGDNSNLQFIGGEAFYQDGKLSEIQLPAGLVQIGDYAFQDTGLKTVTIPASVSDLGAGAFASCHSLTEIKVAEGNANYLDLNGVVYDKAMTTLVEYPAGNTNVSYTVADGATAIGEAAFYGSWNLNTVALSLKVNTVDEYAFFDCKNIRHYTLSDALTYIKQYAFSKNTSLWSMAIPDNVIQISNYAFAEDWSLSSVTFTENSKLPRISFGAFAYCGLTSFRVPASVSTMAQYAFTGCDWLTSFTFAKNSKLESISAYMFDGCDNLRTITFESGSALTSIQAHGLEGMRKLTSIDFGDAKLINIDNFAFRFCESLKNFTIPNGVTSLGRYAFYYCTNLESVTVPESVEHIGRFAFLGTKNINVYFAAETLPEYLAEDWDHGVTGYYLGVTEVVTDGDWQYAKLTDGNIAILNYTGDATTLDLTALNFGGQIVNIGGGAFAYSTVESVKLPESVVTVQAEAFYHSALKSITIPASVEFIGREAFADTPIQTLTFASNAKLSVIEQSAFENTKQLLSVTLPASLKQTGRAIFKNSGIRTLHFAEGFSLTEISEEAFAYTNITSLKLPDSITVLNHSAFRETASLETVSFGTGKNLTLYSNVFYHSGLKTLEIPANMTYIGEYAFVGLSELTEFRVAENNPNYKAVDGLLVSRNGRKLIAVPAGRTGSLTVPAGIEVIGFGAFEDSGLSEVLFREDANILSFGYRAFFGMKNLTEIRIPASVVAIDYYAFANCTALRQVTFAEGNLLRGVYEGAFYGCKNLCDITLPDSIVEISDFAFYGCRRLTRLPVSDTSELKGIYSYGMAYTGLTELTLPETVIDLDSYAFKGAKLKTVTIPDTNALKLIIGIGAFEDCYELTEITLPFLGAEFEDDAITWFGYIFGAGGYEANSIYVPESLKKVTIVEGLTCIGANAFSGLTSIEEIDVPHSVTTLYWNTFKDTTAKYELTNTITTISRIDWNGTKYYEANRTHFGTGLSGHLELSDSVTSIGEYAFSGCRSLTSITIPDSVMSISDYAFSGCSRLTSVTIGNGVTSIGDDAFWNCSSLTSITIPDSVTSIGSYAFSDCSSLTSITIGNGVTSIGDWAFRGCSSLTSITIPDSVTSIGYSAFSGGRSLESITIPDSVTSIDNHAFSWCSSLTSITIPDSVTSIGSKAFEDCSGLTSVTIGNGVTSIGSEAFEYCSSLTSVTIGNSVTSIGYEAFSWCSSLYVVYNNSDLNFTIGSSDYGKIAYYTKLIVDKNGNKTYKTGITEFEYIDTADGFRFVKESGQYKLIAYLSTEDTVTLPTDINGNSYTVYRMRGVRNVIIPEGVTTIGDYAFYECRSLESITIPDSVTSIGSKAFEYCSSLTSITIPDSVTSIEYGAFYGCSSLESITIPDSVVSIGSYVFYGCSSLTSITIPDSVKSIGYSAFSGCSRLESITIPDSVTSIGEGAFAGCSSLTSVTIGNGVTSIGSQMFNNCSSLASITIPDSVTSIDRYAFSDCRSLESITIPDSVTSIGSTAFAGCSSLTHVTIGSGLNNLGSGAFADCPIADFQISDQNANFTFVNGILYDKKVTAIKYVMAGIEAVCIPASVTDVSGAFSGNEDIKIVTFETETQIKSIGYYAFWGCSSLTSITIPDSVTSIGSKAFEDCSGLTSITIGDGVTSIGSRAFYGCSGLESITIPDSVTSIGDYAFWNCSRLTSITIPDSVTSIGDYAFSGCSSLTSINVSDNNSYYCSVDGILYDKPTTRIIWIPGKITGHVSIPIGVTSIGKWAFSGCSSLTSITIPDSVTSIGGSAFSGCSSLTSVTIGNSVTSIGNYAFRNCSSLTSITIPDSVTSIGSYAFSDCSSLTSITIGNGVTSIGDWAFDGCGSLTSITIPDSVTSIDSGAFNGCSSLTSITIGNGVTSIGDWAFNGCSSLTSITILDSVTSIGAYAFDNCSSLYVINNNSDLNFTIGSSDYGKIAYYAKLIIDKNGNKTYKTGITEFEYIDTADGFRFMKENGQYKLIAYLGAEDTVTLPTDINGNSYTVYRMRGVRNVIIPNGVTCIGDYAFYECRSLESITIPDSVTSIGSKAFEYCSSLTSITIGDGVTSIGSEAFSWCRSLESITIPDSVTYIGSGVFSRCYSLTSITIPDSVTSIGWYAFEDCCSLESITIPDSVTSIGGSAFSYCSSLTSITIPDGVTSIDRYAFSGCSSLTSITIPDSVTSIGWDAFNGCGNLTSITISDSVTSIGARAFLNTAYYNDPNNWENSALYIGNHLIRVSESSVFFEVRQGTKSIAYDAFTNCYKLKKLTIGGNHSEILSTLTNLETLVITEMPTSHRIYQYFGWNPSNIPITLKNIVLADGVRMYANAFYGISGVTIYVAANEKDVKWDENFPGWNNGNKVVYGDKWITADFYDTDGSLLSSEIFMTSQVIRQPYVTKADDERYAYEFVGWDLDGDGIADTLPATSTINISAQPIFVAHERMYTVNFYDKDGMMILYSYLLPYGSIVTLPEEPTKIGYTFLGWNGYTDGMIVTGDIAIYSSWSHNGAHVYGETVWVAPTCTEQGYNKHICRVCGEWYGTDYVEATGHSYTVTTVSPTCTEQGYELHTCIHCGDSYCDNYTEAKGHTFGEWIVDTIPTCTERGLQHHICSICNVSENEIISATGHSYKSQMVKEATCTERGEIRYTCAHCGDQSHEYTEMTAHHYQKKEVSKSWLHILIEKVLNAFFGYEGNNAFYYECVDCHRIQTREEVSQSSSSSAQSTCKHVLGEWTEILPATCVAGNVKARICTVCGESVEFRCGVATVDHNYQTEWSSDGTSHWHECSVCGERKDEASHTYRSDWSNNGTSHWHECSVCGEKTDEEHIFDNACDTTCNVCGYTRTITHSYKTEWSNDGTYHWHECSVCGDKTDNGEHIFDNACDTTCNVCGYTRTTMHSINPYWSSDGTSHWIECSVCGVKTAKLEHIFDNACDTTCNVCGYTRTITHSYQTDWSNDGTSHWHECSVCGDKTDNGEHIFDNSCDTTCNVCGYTRTITHSYKTEWSNDGTYHWHECSVCGDKTDNGEHIFDNTCDTTCNVCGYTRSITHSYKTDWSNDGTSHWHECSVCGDKTDLGDHTWDAGVVTKPATVTETGVKTFTCTVCGQEKTESIEKLPAIEETTVEETTVEETTVEETTVEETTGEEMTGEETTVEETTGEDTTTRSEKTEGGCESSVGSCFLLLAVIVPAVMVRKKKESE